MAIPWLPTPGHSDVAARLRRSPTTLLDRGSAHGAKTKMFDGQTTNRWSVMPNVVKWLNNCWPAVNQYVLLAATWQILSNTWTWGLCQDGLAFGSQCIGGNMMLRRPFSVLWSQPLGNFWRRICWVNWNWAISTSSNLSKLKLIGKELKKHEKTSFKKQTFGTSV